MTASVAGATKKKQRLTHIDCMRGVACILMFQTHAYDSWLGGQARLSDVALWSQLASTLAATSFLFLTGFSLALSVESLERRGASPSAVVSAAVRRGAQILLFALVFRGQEFVWRYHGPWTNFFRVDVLNVIGVSIALMGLICWIKSKAKRGLAAATVAICIAMLTPLMWTTLRPRFLPWYLESYINGVHIFNEPQPWLFPIFPWAAFCFAGLAAGSLLRSEWAERRGGWAIAIIAWAGLVIAIGALRLDALPIQLYRVYDFWHTSPNFFLVRIGLLLELLAACYLWSLHQGSEWFFNRMVQLGQNSLLVYWVHIWFVYGGFSILPKRASSVTAATAGLAGIIAAMMLLAWARPWLEGQGKELAVRVRGKLLPAGEV
jgi:uncharacterized membrane protein